MKAEDSTLPSYDFKRILLLGEADFSFTRAFATAHTDNRATKADSPSRCSERPTDKLVIRDDCRLIATEFGNGEDLMKRYYNDDPQKMKTAISSLCQLEAIEEVVCGLNARLLGDKNPTKCKCQRWNKLKKEWDPPASFWENPYVRDTSNKSLPLPFDLIIFNFPHSDQAGRATKLVRALFKQLRICIDEGRLAKTVELEMRLRTIETDPTLKKNIRSFYNHEEAAAESKFELVSGGCWTGDLERWEKLGYRHKWTRKNASCRDMATNCKVWRWRSK
uniref:25S rRNA (uridine-N(3))-methyltransferase BMT5-like domain-containing protein n=1 Tax=Chaetoceros debilis TaxID=122233 RepID=A0A7S3V422_9STRA|mmetsp:Transcript_16008/g.23985  ORF Transcript_16008/g.23985 Transcript_16008/m.23985 type:complete len:277 (+) Transcript_16008:69-899(+)